MMQCNAKKPIFFSFSPVFGAHFSKRALMLPWLVGQGLLVMVLACLALYYLSLFPDAECASSDAKTHYGHREWEPRSVDCPVLLWHALVMVLSLLVLVYYIYTVNEFVAQLR